MFDVASLACKQVRTGHKASLNLGQGVAVTLRWLRQRRQPRSWLRQRVAAALASTLASTLAIDGPHMRRPHVWGSSHSPRPSPNPIEVPACQLGRPVGRDWSVLAELRARFVGAQRGSGKWRSHDQWRMANGVRWALGSRVWGGGHTRSHNLSLSLSFSRTCVEALASLFTCAYVKCVRTRCWRHLAIFSGALQSMQHFSNARSLAAPLSVPTFVRCHKIYSTRSSLRGSWNKMHLFVLHFSQFACICICIL